jgi:predicted RNA-binding Zn-ribbon protein involved in translation (DUF1610 family)
MPPLTANDFAPIFRPIFAVLFGGIIVMSFVLVGVLLSLVTKRDRRNRRREGIAGTGTGTGTKGESPAAVPPCPKCGASMVLRTAKKGAHSGSQFYGCSRYPECKGIVNVE